MNGPLIMDPAKLQEAKAAYKAALSANRPELIDADGNNHGASPFDTAPDGTVSFNRWTDASNNRSAQDTFFTDPEKDADGNTTFTRRPAWQQVPEYYNDEGSSQYDTISKALKGLQGEGFDKMQNLYQKALNGIG